MQELQVGQKFTFTNKLSFYYNIDCVIENITEKSIVYSFGNSFNVSSNNITKQRKGVKKFNELINNKEIKFI